jgi:ferredoxin
MTRPAFQVHVEYFAPRLEAAVDGGFTVELARSESSFFIPRGRTILQVLRENGVAISSSCEQGICAACETRVIAGIPDHRDSILSEQEKKANKSMFVCCSGSRTPTLVLDL